MLSVQIVERVSELETTRGGLSDIRVAEVLISRRLGVRKQTAPRCTAQSAESLSTGSTAANDRSSVRNTAKKLPPITTGSARARRSVPSAGYTTRAPPTLQRMRPPPEEGPQGARLLPQPCLREDGEEPTAQAQLLRGTGP
ncbi:hypothetical protein LZ30DRAFT_423195 [Colletotrichum cereale]|nr:hypothetical protein LZ30DRAFT_423195 [Colletotrichum cereale]